MRPNFSCKLNRSNFFLFLIALLITYSLQLNATVRFVSKTGLSIPPYITWENAADSIQKCINISVFGDTIYVANGVYQEQVVMIPGLSLIGAGMDSCVIYLSATGIPAVQTADSCFLTGFKILLPNTLNTWGIQAIGNTGLIVLNNIVNASLGIYLDNSNITLYKNKLENIKTRGVWLFNSNSFVSRNFIYTDPNSPAGSITGIRIDAFTNNYYPVIDSNYIEANGNNGIVKSIGATPTITNNIIRFTQYGADAIHLGGSDSAIVFNNLIIIGTGYGGINNNSITQIKIFNNYIVGNAGANGIKAGGNDIIKNNVVTDANNGIIPYSMQKITVQYNDAWNNIVNYTGFTPDTTNLSVEPMIVNDDTTQGDLDFHLQMFSPLIDAGDPNVLDKDSTRSDIGLFGGPYGESYVYVDLPPRPPVNLTANVEDSTITLTWNRNTEADFGYYKLYRDTVNNFTVDSTKLIASLTDTFYIQQTPANVEILYYKLTAVDNQGNESNPSEQVSVKLVSVINEWVPVNNYVLYQNYPNPFNPSTRIGYKLKERGYVKLYVYDIKGELVSVLVNQTQEAGYYEVGFSVGQESMPVLSSGVYIYQIFVKGENNIPVFSNIKKMVYVK